MNGILVIDKEEGYTSRDIVNIVSKQLKIKKIGHTGTLDPLATGVLVLCLGKSLKVVELLVSNDKEYIATVKLGIETDTLDITGKKIYESNIPNFTKEDIIAVLNNFKGRIKQEVPKYSAVKVKGKKLYEYARNGVDVELPVREVNIYDIELLNFNKDEFTFRCLVSKGTYIRSLIRDIGHSLGIYATMKSLRRTKQGIFSLNDSYSIRDIENNNYKLLDPKDILDIPKIIIDEVLEKKIRNGQVLEKFFNSEMAMILTKDNDLLAIYKDYKDGYVKPYKMF
jgi:tRNA pseudouridine55 synthase